MVPRDPGKHGIACRRPAPPSDPAEAPRRSRRSRSRRRGPPRNGDHDGGVPLLHQHGEPLTRTVIAALRLERQRIMTPTHQTPAEVVTAMGAMQAQDYHGSLWAIGLRTVSPSHIVAAAAGRPRTSLDEGHLRRHRDLPSSGGEPNARAPVRRPSVAGVRRVSVGVSGSLRGARPGAGGTGVAGWSARGRAPPTRRDRWLRNSFPRPLSPANADSNGPASGTGPSASPEACYRASTVE